MSARRARGGSAPIVVVGAGVAGLATALAAAPAPVLLLCRDEHGGGSASALAQGGIAAAVASGDTPAQHAADTLLAGAGHNRAGMVDWLCRQAPAALDWLQGQGVAFDRQGADLALAREGGHRQARVVHAGGDATGAALVAALQARARQAAHITWCGGSEVLALRLRGGHACGVRVRERDGSVHELDAGAVVLATGGLGALFARTSNPAGADGSGLTLALAAGALARDLEFVQFHPTALDVPGHTLPLLTEALRGAGAVLRDHTGRALMAGAHPLGDLAPRDIVARRVWQASRRGPVWLDARAVDAPARHFPTVFATCRAHGLDPARDLLPVAAVAHFHMGGVAVDADGASSVPGLHAVGEVACTGVHGANRLASNSLLEAVACGRRLGAALAQRPPGLPAAGLVDWAERGRALPAAQLPRLRQLLSQAAGPVREGASLRRALAECSVLREQGWQARLGHALLVAALARGDSLGAHHRSDAVPAMRQRMVAVG